jgi:hypothetical protein
MGASKLSQSSSPATRARLLGVVCVPTRTNIERLPQPGIATDEPSLSIHQARSAPVRGSLPPYMTKRASGAAKVARRRTPYFTQATFLTFPPRVYLDPYALGTYLTRNLGKTTPYTFATLAGTFVRACLYCASSRWCGRGALACALNLNVAVFPTSLTGSSFSFMIVGCVPLGFDACTYAPPRREIYSNQE